MNHYLQRVGWNKLGYWQDLCETYKYAENLVGKVEIRKRKGKDGKEEEENIILLPIAHSTQNAQIEVELNLRGEFKEARKVEKRNAVTVIPVTEDSGSRSSGIAPHPLHDKLCYVAGDYAQYCDKKKAEEYYESYIIQLEQWQKYSSNKVVNAIYLYLKKACLIKDLIEEGELEVDEKNKLRTDIKIEGISQADLFVRFCIQDVDYDGANELWLDLDLQKDYQKYYLTQVGELGLDYMTGKYVTCAEKQPSKIRYSGDMAKLISANDSSGFTYRGRFSNRNEALSVGYEPSQKAHNVLKWLIERQGYRKYGSCIVVWNPQGHQVVPWDKNIVSDEDERDDDLEDTKEEKVIPTSFTQLELAENYARKVRSTLNGYSEDIIKGVEQVVILSLEAATPGRLSVVYYNKMQGSQYLDNLIRWYTECSWRLTYLKNKKREPKTPIAEDIIRAGYGVERTVTGKETLDVDEDLMKDKLKQLFPSIVSGKDIPEDMYQAVIRNASRPLAYESYNRRKIQEIACALIHKKYKEKEREVSMGLLREETDRSYLYGRLMALYHKLESDTFTEDEKGKRVTNTERLMAMMVRNPVKTIVTLEEKVRPYWKKILDFKIRDFYERERQQIYGLFDKEDFKINKKLNEMYLLGYNTELSYLRKGIWKIKKSYLEKNEGGQDDEYIEE